VVLLALMLLVVFGITTLFMTSSQAKFNYELFALYLLLQIY